MLNRIYDWFSYPFGMLLGFLYDLFNSNYGWALIVFTLFAKLILVPAAIKQEKSKAKGMRSQAKIAKIRKKFAGDQQKLNEELQKFYQEEGFSSMSGGCGTLLLQFPIIIGLYGAIYKPLSYILRLTKEEIAILSETLKGLAKSGLGQNMRFEEMNILANIENIKAANPNISQTIIQKINNFDFTAFGLNLAVVPKDAVKTGDYFMLIIPVLSMVFSLILAIYSLINQRKTNPQMSKNPAAIGMLFFSTFISFFMAYNFPIGIGIYWTANSLLQLIQTVILGYIYSPEKVMAKLMIDETNERMSKETTMKGRRNDS
ncbi:MAG: YidC/Oxa1 family membrane protein insertase [Clostridia bacterium]|nr:YidC/Oxa1 family membrane protein insertase [Clostridia bacterium]